MFIKIWGIYSISTLSSRFAAQYSSSRKSVHQQIKITHVLFIERGQRRNLVNHHACRQNESAAAGPSGALLDLHHSNEQHLLQRAAHHSRARAAQAVRGPAAARAAARVDHDDRRQPDALRGRCKPPRLAAGVACGPGMARRGRETSPDAKKSAARRLVQYTSSSDVLYLLQVHNKYCIVYISYLRTNDAILTSISQTV